MPAERGGFDETVLVEFQNIFQATKRLIPRGAGVSVEPEPFFEVDDFGLGPRCHRS